MEEVILTVNKSLDEATHVFGDLTKTGSLMSILSRIAVAQELRSYVHTKTCTWIIIAVLFTTAKNWEQ